MKTYLNCLPYLMSQALKASRAATDDEEVKRQVVNAVLIENYSCYLNVLAQNLSRLCVDSQSNMAWKWLP